MVALLLGLAATPAVQAQTTTVSATVQDANGNAYVNGSVTAFLLLNSGQPIPAGARLSTGPSPLDITGSFSISLASPLTYTFTLCGTPTSIGPLGNNTPTQVCFTTPPIAISGASQSITGSLGTVAILGPTSQVKHGVGAPTGTCVLGTFYINDSNGQAYSCNAGAWALINGATGFAGSIALGQYAFGSAASTFAGTTNRIDCSAQAGADLGAKLNACMSALPVGGGVADATNIKGAQTLSTAVTVLTGVTLVFGGDLQVTQTAAVTLSNVKSSILCPLDGSAVFTKGANIDQFTLSTTNTTIQNCSLVGAGGSFTGRGIVLSSSLAQAINNVVSGEASDGIACGAGTCYLNQASSTSAGHPLTVTGGIATSNYVTSTASDGLYGKGNGSLIQANRVIMNPAASTSGLCGININDDQIGDRIVDNIITINDTTNTGNVDKGICDTPTGTHNLSIVIARNFISGVFSGTVTSYGISVNNAAGLTNNWSVTISDNSLVHIGAPITSGSAWQDVDAQTNSTFWEENQTGDSTVFFDGTTTSTRMVLKQRETGGMTFSQLPATMGTGSDILCLDCVPGAPVTSGGYGSVSVIQGGRVTHPATLANSFFVVLTSAYTNSTVTASTVFTINTDNGPFYTGSCELYYQAAATGGLQMLVPFVGSSFYFQDSLIEAIASGTSAPWTGVGGFGTILGATVTSAATNLTAHFSFSYHGGGAGNILIQAESTAAVTLTIQPGSYCFVTQQ